MQVKQTKHEMSWVQTVYNQIQIKPSEQNTFHIVFHWIIVNKMKYNPSKRIEHLFSTMYICSQAFILFFNKV